MFHEKPERTSGVGADSDTMRRGYFQLSSSASDHHHFVFWVRHVAPVVSFFDSHRLGQSAGPRGEQAGVFTPSPRFHGFYSSERLHGSYEDRARDAWGIRRDVEQPVPVDHVNKSESAGTPHDLVHGGSLVGGARGGVVAAEVGLCFDDEPGGRYARRPAQQDVAEQFSGDAGGVALVEGAREGTHQFVFSRAGRKILGFVRDYEGS